MPLTASPVPFQRNLYLASPMLRGGDVLALQQALVLRAVKLEQDGAFGLATQGAVRDFQRGAGLVQDGVVGRATWGKLFSLDPSGLATSFAMGRSMRLACYWRRPLRLKRRARLCRATTNGLVRSI